MNNARNKKTMRGEKKGVPGRLPDNVKTGLFIKILTVFGIKVEKGKDDKYVATRGKVKARISNKVVIDRDEAKNVASKLGIKEKDLLNKLK